MEAFREMVVEYKLTAESDSEEDLYHGIARMLEETQLEESESLTNGFSDAENGNGEADYDEKIDGLHPLMIPEIVNHVLQQLDCPKDLHVCRKVCSMWNQEAVKIIQDKTVVTLRGVQAIIAYCFIMEMTQDLPHQNFRIVGVLEYHTPEIIRFFELFGPTMRTLHIDVWGNRTYSASVFKRLALTRNLKSLSIKFYKFCNLPTNMDIINLECEDIVGSQIFDFEQAPLKLPKLKHLTMDIEDCFGNTRDIEECLRIVILASNSTLEQISFGSITADVYLGKFIINILVNNDIPLRKINQINFLLRLTNKEIIALAKKQIPFRCLKQLAAGVLQPTNLSGFLQTISSTLRKYFLTVPISGNITRANIFPCKMKSLTYLHLNGYQGCLSMLSLTPNLKSLVLENVDLSGMLPYGGYFSDRPPCESVNTLKILSTTNFIDSNVILRMSDYFSKLTSLSIVDVTDDALDMMYKFMPFLKELSISGDRITDEAICGIPNKNCQEIMNTITFFVVDDFVVRKYLFIGNLCHLESVTIKSNFITDLSVMFGVARTLKLKKLCIESKGITDISLGTFERMSLSHLDISECPNFSEVSRKKLSQGFKGQTLVTKRLTMSISSEVNPNKPQRPQKVSQFEYKDLIPVAPLPLLHQRLMFVNQTAAQRRLGFGALEEDDCDRTIFQCSSKVACFTNERAMRQLASLDFWEQLQQDKDEINETDISGTGIWFNAP